MSEQKQAQESVQEKMQEEGREYRLDLSADFAATQAQAAYTVDGAPCGADAFYALACNPAQSVVVEACAGAGKTWMLVSRMILALLGGAKPEEILAITFTRKAAAEMRQRLYQQLQEFSQMTVEELEKELQYRAYTQQSNAIPIAQAAQKLQGLYAHVLQQPHLVQARTFHSWFASLLRAAPQELLLRLELPLEYSLLEDIEQAVEATWQPFYTAVANDKQLRADLQALVLEHQPAGVQTILRNALGKRIEIELADKAGVAEDGVAAMGAIQGDAYATLRGVATPDDLLKEGSLHRANLLDLAQGLGQHGTPKQQENTAQPLMDAVLAGDAEQVLVVGLTKTNQTPYAFFTGSSMKKANVLEVMEQGVASLKLLQVAVQQHHAWLYHQRVLRLVRALFSVFRQVKQQRGWVDMTDMEFAAHQLLSNSDLSAWVQQRLDARLRYLLIDEFQDTSPLQWQALQPWLEGYTGAGGDMSVFIVGDPKQSIYRFRRAEPGVFRQAKFFVQEGLGGKLLSCEHTRRCSQSVVAAVNRVLPSAYASVVGHGVMDSADSPFRAHTTARADVGGLHILPFVRLPTAKEERTEEPQEGMSGWRNTFTSPKEQEKIQASDLEAEQVADWIQQHIAQTGSCFKDVMVLARTNSSLEPLQAALASRGVPVLMRESNALVDCLEVQDVVALLDALCSPHHDLSLVQALRSPLLGCAENDILALAQYATQAKHREHGKHTRIQDAAETDNTTAPETWWQSLQQFVETQSCAAHPLLQQAWQHLQRWQQYVHTLPVHDVLQRVYADSDAYKAYANSVPLAQRPRVLGNLRQLLTISLEFNAARFTTPYAFVRHLKSQAADNYTASATAIVDAVQLFTVHGSKGLEADTVVLLDADKPASRSQSHSLLLQWPVESAHPLTLAFLQSESKPPPSLQAAMEQEEAEQALEACNALYVAATRAKNTLLVSAYERKRGSNQAGSWYKRFVAGCMLENAEPDAGVFEAMQQHAATENTTTRSDALGETANAEPTRQTGQTASQKTSVQQSNVLLLPDLSPDLYPSQKHAQEHSQEESTARPAARPIAGTLPNTLTSTLKTTPTAEEKAMLVAANIGKALHLILQWKALPEPHAELAPHVALQLQQHYHLNADDIAQAVQMARAIRFGEAAWAWDEAALLWQADEVPVLWEGRWLRLDRLVQRASDGQWWVLDYKSSTQPEVQTTLQLQIQCYRRAALAVVQHLSAKRKAAAQTESAEPIVQAAFITGEGRFIAVQEAEQTPL